MSSSPKSESSKDEMSLRPGGGVTTFNKKPATFKKGGQAYTKTQAGRRTTSTEPNYFSNEATTSTPKNNSRIPRSTSNQTSPILPMSTGGKATMPGTDAHKGVDEVFEQDRSSSPDDAEEIQHPSEEDNLKKIMNDLNTEIENNSALTFDDQEALVQMDDEDDLVIEYEHIVGYIEDVKSEPVSGTEEIARDERAAAKATKKNERDAKLAEKTARKEEHKRRTRKKKKRARTEKEGEQRKRRKDERREKEKRRKC